MGEPARVRVDRTPTATVRPPEQQRLSRSVARDTTPAARRQAVRALWRMGAQARLTVSSADDPYEREAERVATTVTGMDDREANASADRGARGAVRRSLASTISRLVQRNGGDRAGPIGAAGGDLSPRAEARIDAMRSGGAPLASDVRGYFEPRFGTDLSSVRVHTGAEPSATAASMQAEAFTVGEHIYFGEGRYQPHTPRGRHLMAHELTHTIQQGGAGTTAAPRRVQRGLLGDAVDWVLEKVTAFAQKVPGYELLTVFLGRDPITQRVVERSAENIVRAALKLVPEGDEIFKDLQESKAIEKAVRWFEEQWAALDLSWAKIRALFGEAWEALSWTDAASPSAAWAKIERIFTPPLGRLKAFVLALGRKLVELIKQKVLGKISEWAKTVRGYELLKFVLGKDPFTDEPVERTPRAFVKAVLDLVPNGAEIFANLEKSKTIDKTVAWLKEEITKLDLTWEKIKGLFREAWDVLSVKDLLNLTGLIVKLAKIFVPPATRVITFAIAVGKKVLQFIFEGVMYLAGPIGTQIVRIVNKAGDAFDRIVADPVGFVKNLVQAVKRGFNQFTSNILAHLKEGLIGWLLGALEGAGLQLPKKWDLMGIVSLVLQILGLSYAKFRAKLVKVVGEERVAMIEKVVDFVVLLVTKGLAAAWEKLVESIGNLWDMVIGGIRDWVVSKIVTAAVTKVVSMLNPAGAVIQAIIAVYNTIAFFVERIKQILALVESIIDSIHNISIGKLDQAANYVEKTMARTIPVILGFLARLIGLGDVSESIKKVITAIQAKVDAAIDKVIAWVVAKAKALVGAVKTAAGKLLEWWKARFKFTSESGEEHELYFQGEGASAELILASTPQRMSAFFKSWDDVITNFKGTATEKQRQVDALDRTKKSYDTVKKLQKDLENAPSTDDGTKKRQDAAKELAKQLGDLAKNIAVYGGDDSKLPVEVLPGFTSGVLALETSETQFLSEKIPAGESSDKNPGSVIGWDFIKKNNMSAGSAWVRMHLLPDRLGGKATDSNLVPARGPTTNTKFRDEIEKGAYEAVKTKRSAPLIWYTTIVKFHNKEPAGFPSSIESRWGEYTKNKGKKWERKTSGAKSYKQSTDFPSPNEGARLLINREGRVRIQAVIGGKVDDTLARLIIDLRGGGYDNWTDLNARLKKYEDAKGGKNPIADFTQKLEAIRKANQDNLLNFAK